MTNKTLQKSYKRTNVLCLDLWEFVDLFVIKYVKILLITIELFIVIIVSSAERYIEAGKIYLIVLNFDYYFSFY